MGMFNLLLCEIRCPHCKRLAFAEIEFKAGYRDLTKYHLGDSLLWDDGPEKGNEGKRPPEGNLLVDGYYVCKCGKDFLVDIEIEHNKIIAVSVSVSNKDPFLPPYEALDIFNMAFDNPYNRVKSLTDFDQRDIDSGKFSLIISGNDLSTVGFSSKLKRVLSSGKVNTLIIEDGPFSKIRPHINTNINNVIIHQTDDFDMSMKSLDFITNGLSVNRIQSRQLSNLNIRSFRFCNDDLVENINLTEFISLENLLIHSNRNGNCMLPESIKYLCLSGNSNDNLDLIHEENKIIGLEISENMHIESIEKITCFKKLRKLKLSKCYSIKDFHPLLNMVSLEGLEILNCNKLDRYFLEKIKENKKIRLTYYP